MLKLLRCTCPPHCCSWMYPSISPKKAVAGPSTLQNQIPSWKPGKILRLCSKRVLGLGSHHHPIKTDNTSVLYKITATVPFSVGRGQHEVLEVRSFEAMPMYRRSTIQQCLWSFPLLLFVLRNWALFHCKVQHRNLCAPGVNFCVMLDGMLNYHLILKRLLWRDHARRGTAACSCSWKQMTIFTLGFQTGMQNVSFLKLLDFYNAVFNVLLLQDLK